MDDNLPPSLQRVPNIPHSVQTLDQLKAERDYWQGKIDSATGWGAGVAAAIEFRKDCQTWINFREAQCDKR